MKNYFVFVISIVGGGGSVIADQGRCYITRIPAQNTDERLKEDKSVIQLFPRTTAG